MLEADYLVVGSGAVGMAFVDTLLEESEASIIMVDRYAKPGGHWNYAYSFVTLHQPSQFYGVASKELSKYHISSHGLNEGLYDMATGDEVKSYFEGVMRNRFIPSGRVSYFPLCEYKGDGLFIEKLTGNKHQVKVNKKIVNCTFLNTSIPSMHTPNFQVSKGVNFIPINDLPFIQESPAGYVIIGGGKTGIDAALWLLENKVEPDHITWIVSRDAWLINRKNTQPTQAFFSHSMGAQAATMEAIAQADSIEDLFLRLEQAEVLLRIDRSITPTMFHGATVSHREIEKLQKIKNVVRLGRVESINESKIILKEGEISTSSDHIHIDCSASAISNLSTKPVFQDKLITPQTVRPYQPVFSASVIAYVEANYPDDKSKNNLCQVVPLPNHDTDWVRMSAAQMANQMTWSQDKTFRQWLRENRLDGFSKMVKEVDRNDKDKMDILNRMRNNALPAMMKLQQFITQLNENKTMKNPQFQVKRKAFFQGELVEVPDSELKISDGEILVEVESFAYSANNITYAVVGDMIGYWKFFRAHENEMEEKGIIPVWGFAKVTASKVDEMKIGERIFGYFPPTKKLKLRPEGIRSARFFEGAAHRKELPRGYNIYRRVDNEPDYNPAYDRERMLLFPLHITSFCLWDALRDENYYGAEQILILSASSKTSTGLGIALQDDPNSPKVLGITSEKNLKTTEGFEIYDQCMIYKDMPVKLDNVPTVIVDMSGNAPLMVGLHRYLKDNMKFTLNVGLTHWAKANPDPDIIKERSTFFFAPGHIQKRIKEWGADKFDHESSTFMMRAAARTKEWLEYVEVDGIQGLAKVHPDVCQGNIPAQQGLIVKVT